MTRRVAELPGVEGVGARQLRAVARRRLVPAASSSPPTDISARRGEENPLRAAAHRRARLLRGAGVPVVAGRDFTRRRPRGSEPVVIVSQSVAERLFPDGDAVNRTIALVDRSALRQAAPASHRRRGRRTSTTRASCRGRRSPSITRCSRCALPAGCSCTPRAIPTRWCRPITRAIQRDVAGAAGRARRDARRTSARKCSRLSG